MKTEGDNSQHATPQPQFQTPQWGGTHIPIDPALQQQSQQHPTPQPYTHYQYPGHYPQATYNNHYQFTLQQPPQQLQLQQQQVQPVARQNTAPATSGGIDTADIATLNDALGNAGIDLRAEEEGLHQSYEQHQAYRSYEDRSRKQPLNPSFDTRFLGPTMRGIGTQHKVTKIPDDAVNYLALALRARLQELITQMIAASHHRTDTQFDRPASLYEDGSPMWSILVRSDVAKQLAALEKAEREDETKARRDRKERSEMAAQQAKEMAAQSTGSGTGDLDGMDDGEGGSSKKKRKKDGPGVTARNMSEDVRKKMSNAVASQAAGLGGKYAWMNATAAASNAGTPKGKGAAATTAAAAATPTPAGTSAPVPTPAPATPATGWSRPYNTAKKSTSAPTQAVEADTRTAITLRDAMFVIEKEKGHGGGRGAARGWV